MEKTLEAAKDIRGLLSGRNFHRPAAAILLLVLAGSAGVLWLVGLGPISSTALGAVACSSLLFRWKQIQRHRIEELSTTWPGFLDRTRAKMLTSSRSLPYVIFEENSTDSVFLNELLLCGKREFETSGELERAIQAMWRQGEDEEVTNYVCSALLDAAGSTSSQMERQLTVISETVRSRNETRQEARSRLAGVRTARTFIVIIPIGMALAGIAFAGSIQPFTTAPSIEQMIVAAAVLALCWHWSTRLMTFPRWPTPSLETSETDREADT